MLIHLSPLTHSIDQFITRHCTLLYKHKHFLEEGKVFIKQALRYLDRIRADTNWKFRQDIARVAAPAPMTMRAANIPLLGLFQPLDKQAAAWALVRANTEPTRVKCAALILLHLFLVERPIAASCPTGGTVGGPGSYPRPLFTLNCADTSD